MLSNASSGMLLHTGRTQVNSPDQKHSIPQHHEERKGEGKREAVRLKTDHLPILEFSQQLIVPDLPQLVASKVFNCTL